MDMQIRQATINDLPYLVGVDRHVATIILEKKIGRGEILVACVDDKVFGLLRFNYFWDEVPFMNLLWLDDIYRGKGLGRRMVEYWEEHMRMEGFKMVMTSTLEVEPAKNFYAKLGYRKVGSFDIGEGIELILEKEL
jgi:GNAT superfamily N-acetyltransferase